MLPSERLQRLYERYNKRYWRGKLPKYRVIPTGLDGSMGRFIPRSQIIQIDLTRHPNDHELRSTMLHEMCHVAAHQRGGRGHDVKFFPQLEHLLRQRAPITVRDPEAGRVRVLSEVVPSRFPLLKRKMERFAAKSRKPLEHLIESKKLAARSISKEEIIRDFADYGSECTWKEAFWILGFHKYQLVDECERPLNPKFKRLLARARAAHRNARITHLREERDCERIQACLSQHPGTMVEMPSSLRPARRQVEGGNVRLTEGH